MPESDIECVSIDLNSINGADPASQHSAPASFGESKTTKTVGPSAGETVRLDKALCTGWLLCAAGPMKGRSWELHPEANQIGRGDSAFPRVTVNLDKDPSVSRGPQVNIMYSIKTVEYFIFAGASINGIVLVNGKPVQHHSAPLKLGDIIEIGDTVLRFVPACDATFYWVKEDTK